MEKVIAGKSVDVDTNGYLTDLSQWNKDIAIEIGKEEGINELTPKHFEVLTYLQEQYPDHHFLLIMGSDNLESIHKWKNYLQILKHHFLYVYPRPGHGGGELKNHEKVKWTEAPLMEISSTFIRKAIKNKRDIRFYLPSAVYNYIEEMNFYKK